MYEWSPSDGAPVVMTKWYENSAAQPSENRFQYRKENYYSAFGFITNKRWFNNFESGDEAVSICEPK